MLGSNELLIGFMILLHLNMSLVRDGDEMKVGDLVRDAYGNIGVVVGTATFGNGPAVGVQFSPNSGYDGAGTSWVTERLLEVISAPDHPTAGIANDPIDW